MKLKYTFEKVEMDGEVMAVPVGDNADHFHAMLRLNETAAFILDQLKEETTEEEVAAKVLKAYKGDEAKIRGYVHKYLATLSKNGILE